MQMFLAVSQVNPFAYAATQAGSEQLSFRMRSSSPLMPAQGSIAVNAARVRSQGPLEIEPFNNLEKLMKRL
jgi:hypothetical protein